MIVLNTRRIGLIAFFTLLTAILAQITVYLPFTPVPIILQTLAVVLSGIIGSALVGFLSHSKVYMIVYVFKCSYGFGLILLLLLGMH